MPYWVYLLSSRNRAALYIGVTNDLRRRIWEHQNDLDPKSFSARYQTHLLVYYEEMSDPESAIAREKQLKGWRREKKNALINAVNPEWNDLYPAILE